MSFTCPDCKRTSHNPNDEANRFCGACHKFFDEGQRVIWPLTTDEKIHKLRAAHVRWRTLEETLTVISRSPEDAYAHISRLAREAVDEIAKQVEGLYHDL